MKIFLYALFLVLINWKNAMAQSTVDPEVCFLNTISKLSANSQVYTWEIRDACMKIFLQNIEKKAIPIASNLITQANINVSSYGDGYFEVKLKNNSYLNVVYATIGITNISTGEVDRYRFLPIQSDIIGPLSAGVLRGQTRITRDRVKDIGEFGAKYQWSFINVWGYQ